MVLSKAFIKKVLQTTNSMELYRKQTVANKLNYPYGIELQNMKLWIIHLRWLTKWPVTRHLILLRR